MSFLSELLENYSNETMFKPSDVASKLSDFANKTRNNTETTTKTFGLEDDQGNTIKVKVAIDQAEDFERTLASKLDEIDPDDPFAPEIAEVLFSLKSQFDIIDVEWPQIIEDEEPENPNNDQNPDMEDLDNMDDPSAMSGDMMSSPDVGGDMGSSQNDLLQSVIQTLMSDSEARRQESVAKAAEARAKEAEYAAKIAEQKMKAEEEVADMEAYYDAQNVEKKEAKKLAKLAKYRHTLKQQDLEQGPFNDPSEALSKINNQSNDRMDYPSGENLGGIEPDEVGSAEDMGFDQDPEFMNLDIQDDVRRSGVENEEQTSYSDFPPNFNQQIDDVQSAINYLHKLRIKSSIGQR